MFLELAIQLHIAIVRLHILGIPYIAIYRTGSPSRLRVCVLLMWIGSCEGRLCGHMCVGTGSLLVGQVHGMIPCMLLICCGIHGWLVSVK